MGGVVLLGLVVACGRDPAPEGPPPSGGGDDRPDVVCPGDPQCPGNSGPLRAGTAVRDIVPECFESWDDLDGNATFDPIAEPFHDCGCDRLCDGDPGYPGPDEGEGDGTFQAIWIAGFQSSRPAQGVRDASLGLRGEGDGLEARAVVLEQGETRIGIVALDAFGFMMDDVLTMRQLAADAGHDLDHLVIHSSHTHAAPDSLGIYGQNLTTSGYDSRYAGEVHDKVVDALGEAIDGLTEVTLSVGEVDANDYHPDGVGNLVVDSRDPAIVDPMVGVARFTDPGGQTVATLVHFANHPEATGGEYALFTSNYVHALRQTVESGVDWDDGSGLREGIGGTAVFLNGTLGGMMTSLGAQVEHPDGTVPERLSFEKADAVGHWLGEMALDAVEGAEEVPDARIAALADSVYLPVVNNGFQAMFLVGVFDHRSIHNYDPALPIDEGNIPDVQSEVGIVDIGPLRMLTLPGEPLPELAVGGYDGSFTPPNQDLVDPDNPNPPDMGAAPPGPYLHEVLGTRYTWVLGLANDQIGYVIPAPYFEVGEVAYLIEAEGDHYEETNSLGPDTAQLLTEAATDLLEWSLQR